ncbi:acyl carrier protein [Amycolatopsis sp. H20-H5]|uniref:acyl carrier protein n=1 Tax=Amycolatopsis sp. H20-H5 TaxID=3046309 RepID=UPI002DB595E5|nr:acyl carrier protein [Amycolatopsis sp. H20-H5]MEC3975501.1 acyl carrier protein [Amycolatopsis sp. H20-H5]
MSASTEEFTKIRDRIMAFVRDELAGTTERDRVTATTPLLEAGILDSLGTTQLITWLRVEMGVKVPPMEMTGKNFRDVDRITDLVVALRATV